MYQGTMGCQKTCKVDKFLQQSQREVLLSQKQRIALPKKSSWTRDTDKVSMVGGLSLCCLLISLGISFDSSVSGYWQVHHWLKPVAII